MIYTAVLMACYNRVDSTLKCLSHLDTLKISKNHKIEIYLTDDNSPDKTGELVKKEYKEVNIIKGTGDLYWCGGMRLAWEYALKNRDYDYFFWLNDDVYLFQDSLLDK